MSEGKAMRADVRRNREAIIVAARAAFGRGEFDRRFDDFAALSGVGVGTLYRHFPTREALAEAVYLDEVDALCRRAEQLLAERPPAEALTTFLQHFLQRMADQRGLALTLATLLRHQSDTQAEGGRALEEAVTKLVTAATVEGHLANEISPGAVMTALHGIGSTQGRASWQDDAEKLIAAIVATRD